MKKEIIIMTTVVMIAAVMAGCTENRSVRDVKGTYSYKTSGTLKVDGQTINLPAESGQMEIVSLHDGDSVLFTFNRMGGEAYCTKGAVSKEGNISFAPFERRLTLAFDTTRLITLPVIEDFDITASGSGHYYDNTVILNLSYNGMSADSLHTLTTEAVTTIGKRN